MVLSLLSVILGFGVGIGRQQRASTSDAYQRTFVWAFFLLKHLGYIWFSFFISYLSGFCPLTSTPTQTLKLFFKKKVPGKFPRSEYAGR